MTTSEMARTSSTRRDLFRAFGITTTAAAAGASLSAACGEPGGSTGATGNAGTAGTAAQPAGSPAASGGPEVKTLRVGYLPITDATPLLLAHAQGLYTAEGLEPAQPTRFRGWSQIAEAFQARQVDVVHLLMPTVVWMRFAQSFPVKLVAWNHTDGSALTVANNVESLDDFAGTTVAIPFWYSIHNTVLQLLFRKAGLTPLAQGEPSAANKTVKLVVMAPSDMVPALANGSIAGYIVADPFNAMAEVQQIGRILRFTGDAWLNHACCVVIMHEDDTQKRPRWAQAVINAVAKAQLFARDNRKETARILSTQGGGYLPQALPAIERALAYYDQAEYGPSGAVQHPDWPNSRIGFQPFPFRSYTEELVRQLRDTVVDGDNAFLKALDPAMAHSTLIDDRFARAAITAAGGPAKFGIPADLTRTERLAP